jgi:hypothetical protein
MVAQSDWLPITMATGVPADDDLFSIISIKAPEETKVKAKLH